MTVLRENFKTMPKSKAQMQQEAKSIRTLIKSYFTYPRR